MGHKVKKDTSSWGPFYKHGLTLIPKWKSNYAHYKARVEITYPFSIFNGAAIEVLGMDE